MFPFMHVFIPLLVMEIPFLRNKIPIQRFSLSIGAMLPDLIDKPLTLIFNISGRGFGHTPLYLLLLTLCLFGIMKDRSIAYSLAIGWIFHLLLDISGVPWFAPFIDYDFLYTDDPLSGWWWALMHNPMIIVTELISVIGLIGMALHYRLFINTPRIKVFLFSTDPKLHSSLIIPTKGINN